MNQDHFNYPLMKIGIIGGGQLGKMMAQKAKKMGFYITVIDPTPNCPAAQVVDKQIVGNFYDRNKIRELVKKSDITTFDIEHIDVEVLKELVNEGHKIFPSPYLLDIIQDKLKQKNKLYEGGIPIPKYQKVESPICLEKFGFPVVQKVRKGGYDGRGVVILKDKGDLKNAIKAESLVEEFIDFEKELAVMVAKNTEGEVKCYPFLKKWNICLMHIARPENICKARR